MKKAVMILAVALATGCAGEVEPTAEKLEQGLQAHFDQYQLPAQCVGKRFHDFPYPVDPERLNFRYQPDGPSNGELLAGLESAGLVHQQDGSYRLTDQGRQVFLPEAGFCYGRLRVESVDRISDVLKRDDVRAARVAYTVAILDRPAWSQTPGFLRAFDITDSGFQNGKRFAGPDRPHPERREAVLVDDGGEWAVPGFL